MSEESKKDEKKPGETAAGSEVAAMPPSKPEAPQTMTEDFQEFILVAEDSAPNRNILCHLLRKLGFNVKEAADGEVAWGIFERAMEEGKLVQAVISDIMMPKTNGIELLERVRKYHKGKDTKFVLVTAVSEKDYIMQAKQWEVNGYLLKPISYDKIRAKLEQLFPDRKIPKVAA